MSGLLFNTTDFRFRTYGVTLPFEVAAFLLSFVLVYLVYRMKFPEETPMDDVTTSVLAKDDGDRNSIEAKL